MTALNFPESQAIQVHPVTTVSSPEGWITTGIHVVNLNSKTSGKQEEQQLLDTNLSHAAKLTEQLIDGLKEGMGVEVPVSYMRVEKNTSFHILLLLNDFDFHSPKIVSARLLAERFAKTEGFHVRFVFAIESENRMNNTIKFGGYKLMHRTTPENDIPANH